MTVDFAERLNRLFDVVVGPDGQPYSNEAVLRGITAKGEGTISRGYLSELRTGKKTNPTKAHMEALADFFGVSAAYFVADQDYADQVAAELQLQTAMRNADVRSVALRAARLSPRKLELAANILDQIAREELDDDTPGPSTQQTSADDDDAHS